MLVFHVVLLLLSLLMVKSAHGQIRTTCDIVDCCSGIPCTDGSACRSSSTGICGNDTATCTNPSWSFACPVTITSNPTTPSPTNRPTSPTRSPTTERPSKSPTTARPTNPTNSPTSPTQKPTTTLAPSLTNTAPANDDQETGEINATPIIVGGLVAFLAVSGIGLYFRHRAFKRDDIDTLYFGTSKANSSGEGGGADSQSDLNQQQRPKPVVLPSLNSSFFAKVKERMAHVTRPSAYNTPLSASMDKLKESKEGYDQSNVLDKQINESSVVLSIRQSYAKPSISMARSAIPSSITTYSAAYTIKNGIGLGVDGEMSEIYQKRLVKEGHRSMLDL